MYRHTPMGPHTFNQMRRLARVWEQGEHIFVSGPTGSGKTALTRHIVDIRIKRGGHVVVFCMKPLEDETITNEYGDFERWKTWKSRPSSWEKKILLWPDVTKARGNKDAILDIQRKVFSDAFDGINASGKYTVQVDEGLYAVHPQFLGMSGELAMSHAIGRSGDLTMVTLAQRPSHLPLLLYGSASHAFVGRTREKNDQQRLAELGSREGSRELARRIADQGRHDFLWVPVAPGWPAETVNLAR
jgi:energy-coupling factor transporter ATP-binding protein EcfA2